MLPLVLLLAGSLGLAWLFKPTDEEMLERVLKDRHFNQLIACLQVQGHVDGAKAAELRRVSGRRLAVLARLFQLTPREQLHVLFLSGRSLDYDLLTHGLVLRAIQFVDVIPPDEAFEIIRMRLHEVPPELRLDLLDLIGKNSHAVGKPELAVECYRLAANMPESRWSTLQKMTQTFRWEKRTLEASEILRRWLLKHESSLSAKEQAEARALQYVMALEAGHPSEAFDRCLVQLQALAPSETPDRELIVKTVQAATYSGRSGEVLPWLEKFVNVMPDHDIAWNHLPKMNGEEPQRFADLKRLWGTLARVCDWSRKMDQGFDYHLRAAALGDEDALDRCLALHSYLGRTEDAAELLQLLVHVPNHEKVNALLPQMLGNLGREQEACELYRHWLARHPDDRDSRHALACLLEDLGDDDGSMKQLEELLRRKPEDTPALQKLAHSHMRKKNFRKALELLEQAPEKAHNDETLEGYASLAESLDLHDSRLRALLMMIKRKEQPEPKDYLDLADAAGYTTQPHRALEMLADGIKRFPDEVTLRLALASLHAQRQDYTGALAVAMHPPLRGKFEIADFILALAPHVEKAGEALEFIGNDVEKRFPLAVADRLNLAVLHHKAGHPDEVKRLFATVPETPDNLRILATARFHCQDFAQSERLMLALFINIREIYSNDWVFLGDIYELLNRPEDAQRAYDQSLKLLSSDLPNTAAR